MDDLREWLTEKQARGVERVSVRLTLAKLDEIQAAIDNPDDKQFKALLLGKPRKWRYALMRYLIYSLKPEFVGTKEVAEDILHVERPRIGRYTRSGVMPPPVATVSVSDKGRGIPFWLREDVEPLVRLVEGRRRDHDGEVAAAK